jgi:hypothetical protein
MLLETACSHITAILTEAFELPLGSPDGGRILLVYDELTPLARLLSAAYRRVLPHATAIPFEDGAVARIGQAIDSLNPGDLVILVQSTSFRLDAFRIRVHLFERGLKVIEHPHLGRVREEELGTYIAALAYDSPYYHRVGQGLKDRLDRAGEVRLVGGGHSLVYGGGFEASKLNIGDYRGMKNIGGQFPIGEVFTELHDLTRLNGSIGLFAFGDKTFSVSDCPTPIVIDVREGRLVGSRHTVPDFEAVLQDIRHHEGDVWVRELGFGLNRALTRATKIRNDVGIYERMCGVHLSLGSKHALYPKAGFHKKKVKFHVDVFAAVDSASIDGEIVYQDGAYRI